MKGEIILYQTEEGNTKIEVILDDNTVWLNQAQMEDLFQTDRTSILKHIKNIYKTGELEEAATCAKIAQVRQEGNRKVKREILYYNLDVIIAVGYRVNSHRGTQFRIWATQQLKEYLIKGFILNYFFRSVVLPARVLHCQAKVKRTASILLRVGSGGVTSTKNVWFFFGKNTKR